MVALSCHWPLARFLQGKPIRAPRRRQGSFACGAPGCLAHLLARTAFLLSSAWRGKLRFLTDEGSEILFVQRLLLKQALRGLFQQVAPLGKQRDRSRECIVD